MQLQLLDRAIHGQRGGVAGCGREPAQLPVVRLAGTNVEAGKAILAQSGLPIITANSLMDAAEQAVAAWKGTMPADAGAEAAQ